jgi:signal transduction histidine kinase/ligand-binding sensor domain-containing protein/DNA-binding response OmpR family regulator
MKFLLNTGIALIWIMTSGFFLVSEGQENFTPGLEVRKNTIEFDRLYFKDEEDNYSVEDIHRDSLGFIWFATKEGLFRYDGRDFRSFPELSGRNDFNSSVILSLAPGNNNQIWVLTPKEIVSINILTLDLNSYPINLKEKPKIGNIFRAEIFVDNHGIIYAGYWGGGMLILDPAEGAKTHYYDQPDFPVKSKTVTTVYPKSENELWIGSHDGLFVYNKVSRKFHPSDIELKDSDRISTNQINSICKDNDSTLWLATNMGLIKYSLPGNETRLYRFEDSPIEGYEKNIVESLTCDEKGYLYIGTRYGLHILDIRNDDIQSYFHSGTDENTIQSNYIRKVNLDDQKILWIGHHSGTISKLAPRKKAFTSYRLQSDYTGDLRVFSVFKSGNTIWFGTESGLYSFKKETSTLIRYSHDPGNPNSLSNDFVSGIQQDKNGFFWIATDKGGINRFDPETGIFENILSGSQELASYSETDIWYITMGRDHYLYCGTGGSGILRINTLDGSYMNYTYHPERKNSLSSNFIGPIIEDENGFLWVGTIDGGLNYFDPEMDTSLIFNHISGDPTSRIDNSMISSLCQVGQNELWIGTNKGLKILDQNSMRVSVSESETLEGVSIASIVEDVEGDVWISSSEGLFKFDQRENNYRNYRKSDGLGSLAFIPGCFFLAPDGELFFGSFRGFLGFYPREITDNQQIPEVRILSFYLSGKEVAFTSSFKEGFINRKIKLPYDQNNIGFSFASLDFFDPDKNQFEYILEGFDENWTRTHVRNEVSYNNLPPGDYTFRIRASNNDNYWNMEGDSISVLITPPFWDTILFKVGLLVFILSGIFVFINLRIRSIRNQKQELEKLVKQRTKEVQLEKENVESKNEALEKQKSAIELQAIQLAEINKKLEEQQKEITKQASELREMNRLKSSFFANISHEFRTPLTLIINSLNDLGDKTKDQEAPSKALVIARRSSLRLQRLIDQLLDLTKIESGFMRLTVSPGNMSEFIKSIAEGFQLKAASLKVSYVKNIKECKEECYADWDKLEKILYNLLSNAFKFTPEGGSVWLEAQYEKNDDNSFLLLSITDSGVGIPLEDQKKVFSRFFRGQKNTKDHIPGTGIGLALVKQLLHIYHGEIQLVSEPGKGSVFIVRVPVSRSSFKDEEIIDTTNWNPGIIRENILLTETVEEKLSPHAEKPFELPVFLFIDDNRELCSLIKDRLSQFFNVLIACDGQEGFEVAIAENPDIIVTDIMMPGISGIDLCHKIKKDIRTDHIPVILLTASKSEETEVGALKVGADDYIGKPFSVENLRLKVNNLMETRRNMERKLAKDFLGNESSDLGKTQGQGFLKKAIDVINKNLDNPEFNVNLLAEGLYISRTQLYRKFKQFTSIPVNDFIKDVKLKKAYQYLLSGNYNVNEVALKCGFNTPGYFSKCFEEKYGILPSKFILERSWFSFGGKDGK